MFVLIISMENNFEKILLVNPNVTEDLKAAALRSYVICIVTCNV